MMGEERKKTADFQSWFYTSMCNSDSYASSNIHICLHFSSCTKALIQQITADMWITNTGSPIDKEPIFVQTHCMQACDNITK